MQIADSRHGSGGFRCRWLMRLWRVLGQIADDFGGFGWRWLMRFRRVPVQMADKVPEGSGADSQRPSLPRSSKLLGITHEFI